MARLLRAHDWSKSTLGAPSTWPSSLQSAVRIMLSSGHPTAIWWGATSVCLFNDAHFLAIGEHCMLDSIGLPAQDHWAAGWSLLRSQAARVMAGQGATWSHDRLIPLTRRAELQDTYWNYSLSPIEDAAAHKGVGGVLLIAIETTDRVLADELITDQIKSQQQHFLAAPSFIAILRGPLHTFDFVNSATRRLLDRQEFLGRAVFDVLPELRDQEYPAILDRVLLTGERYVSTRRSILLQRGAGRAIVERMVNFVCEPIVDKDGATTGIFVEGFDVTEAADADTRAEDSKRKVRRHNERWTPLFAPN